jgi:hypothetical protein
VLGVENEEDTTCLIVGVHASSELGYKERNRFGKLFADAVEHGVEGCEVQVSSSLHVSFDIFWTYSKALFAYAAKLAGKRCEVQVGLFLLLSPRLFSKIVGLFCHCSQVSFDIAGLFWDTDTFGEAGMLARI